MCVLCTTITTCWLTTKKRKTKRKDDVGLWKNVQSFDIVVCTTFVYPVPTIMLYEDRDVGNIEIFLCSCLPIQYIGLLLFGHLHHHIDAFVHIFLCIIEQMPIAFHKNEQYTMSTSHSQCISQYRHMTFSRAPIFA